MKSILPLMLDNINYSPVVCNGTTNLIYFSITFQASSSSSGTPAATNPSNPDFNSIAGNVWNPDQNALMRQMYANYMTQYVQYLQSIGAMQSWPASAAQSLVDQTNQIAEEARLQQPPAPIFEPVAAAAAAAMANNLQQNPAAVQIPPQNNQIPVENINEGPNVVLNAGAGGIGAMEDDDELNGGQGGQRDLLDWCYVVTRVLVLFSIVYFYSSLARFALAAGLGIIFYLYNNGFFGQQQNQQPHEAAVQEVRQVAGAAGGEENPENVENTENIAENENIATPQAPPPQPHPLNVLSTFVTTFFTSLLPNDPQVV